MASKVQFRRDTTTNWSNANPTLSSGELGLDTTAGRIKIGDGSTAWNSLGSFGLNRYGTASSLTSSNPTLLGAEIATETDTQLSKVGDNTSAWNVLPYVAPEHVFRLSADGSAIGSAIADYFGASSTITLAAAASYEVEFELYFLKTTAGTVTFTLTSGQAPVNLAAYYIGGPVAGIGTAGAPITAGIVASTSTAAALPATTSLTTAVNHHFVVKAMIDTHATLTSTFKIRCTESAGTITPLRGSNYKVRRLPNANSGAFA